ncbi:hypothetical protein ACP4OV_007628 [Aristida adscensionis]
MLTSLVILLVHSAPAPPLGDLLLRRRRRLDAVPARAPDMLGFAPSKTHVLRWFHSVHAPYERVEPLLYHTTGAVASSLSWRWLLALTSHPCFLLLPFFGITPESPRYLCAHSRMSDAMFVLERMASVSKSALPPGVLTYHQETNEYHDTITSENEHLLPVREEFTVDNAIYFKYGGIDALRKLLSRKLLRSTLLLWFACFANSFAYYGLILLASQLNDSNRSCKSGQMFEVLQKDTDLYKDTFISSLAEIPGLIIAGVLVDWFGRKATMWCTLFACCAFLGPLVVHQNELLTTALLFGARACGVVSSTVLTVYDKEMYPTNVRSTGVGIATAVGRIGGMVCPLIAVGMLLSCHQMEAVLVFEVVLCLAGVACILFPVETTRAERWNDICCKDMSVYTSRWACSQPTI